MMNKDHSTTKASPSLSTSVTCLIELHCCLLAQLMLTSSEPVFRGVSTGVSIILGKLNSPLCLHGARQGLLPLFANFRAAHFPPMVLAWVTMEGPRLGCRMLRVLPDYVSVVSPIGSMSCGWVASFHAFPHRRHIHLPVSNISKSTSLSSYC